MDLSDAEILEALAAMRGRAPDDEYHECAGYGFDVHAYIRESLSEAARLRRELAECRAEAMVPLAAVMHEVEERYLYHQAADIMGPEDKGGAAACCYLKKRIAALAAAGGGDGD